MTVLLDNAPLTLDDLSADATVTQALDQVKRQLAGGNTVIIGLREKGRDILPDQLDELLQERLSEHQDLEIVSGRPVQVALEAMEDIRRAFGETFAVAQQAGEAISQGNVEQAMSGLGECLGVWARAHQAVVESSALLNLSLNTLVVADRPMAEWLNELVGMLRNLKEAVEARDNVLLGDVLRYELDETLQHWEHMLGGYIDHLKQQS